jgi:hypothetical protein
MDLNELKKGWCKVTAKVGDDGMMDITKIDQLLQKRGSGILSRLDRNVKTGFWLLGLFLLLTLIDQYLPIEKILPLDIEEKITVPLWIRLLGIVVNFFVMLSFILFVYRYNKLKIKSLAAQNMETALRNVLRLLDTFKKEFYLALIIFLTAAVTGFLYGAWTGFTIASGTEVLEPKMKIAAGAIVIVILAICIAVIFYIFHKGFNSLYGKYSDQLTNTLNELEETEE